MLAYQLSSKQQKYSDEYFSALQIDDGDVDALACLKIETEALRFHMYTLVPDGQAYEIGGDLVSRDLNSNQKLWINIPPINGSNIFKYMELNRDEDACNCQFTDCVHCNQPSIVLSTHSIYYMSPVQIAGLVNKSRDKLVYAVVHNVSEFMGTLGADEAVYYYTNDGVVIEYNEGPPIIGSNMSWLFGTDSYFIKQGVSLCWRTVRRIGSTLLMSFTVGAVDDQVIVVNSIAKMLSSEGHSRLHNLPVAISHKPISVHLEGYVLDVDEVFSNGMILSFTSKERKINLPKGLVDYVVKQITGTARTQGAWQNALHFAKQYMANLNLPSHVIVDGVIYGTALGFVKCLEEEVEVLNSLNRRFSRLYDLHAKLLDMRYHHQPHLYIIFALLLVNILAWIFIHNYKHNLLILITSICILSWFLYYYAPSSGTSWSRRRQITGQSTHLDSIVVIPDTTTYTGIESTKDPSLMRLTALVEHTGYDRNAPKNPGTPNIRLIHAGIAFSTCTPQVLEPSLSNEYLAIMNRVTRVVPPLLPAAMEEYLLVLNREHFQLLTRDVDIASTPSDFKIWNARFPKAVAEKHNKAMNLITQHTKHNKFHSISKAFIKLEKVNGASTVSGTSDSNPRLIQGQNEHLNVLVGPWMYKFSNHVKRAWNDDSHVYFASGTNAVVMGKWFENKVTKFMYRRSGVGYLIIDYEKYDSTVNESSFILKTRIYKDCGLERNNQTAWDAVMRDVKQVGYTRHGWYYETDYGTGSGKADTTVGNSIVNAGIVTTALKEDDRYDLSVLGDDNIVIGEYDYLVEQLEPFITFANNLGFQPVARVVREPWLADFCSKLPYPAMNPRTGEECILFGPKLGRLMHRIGWNITVAGAANLAATCRELMVSCKHIPFLFDLVQRMNTVMKPHERKCVGKTNYEYWGTNSLVYEEHPMIWNFMYRRYGLTQIDYVEFVAILDQVEYLPSIIEWPRINELVEIDSV